MCGIELLSQARESGLAVEAHEGLLIVRGPRRHEAFMLRLLERKADILAALAVESAAEDLDSAWQAEFEERAAIRQYEAGLRRELAETLATRDIAEKMQRLGVESSGFQPNLEV